MLYLSIYQLITLVNKVDYYSIQFLVLMTSQYKLQPTDIK